MKPTESIFSVGRLVSLACLLEVTAPKPGNVHRGADFEDVTFSDFAVSALAIGQTLEQPNQSVGESILASVQATQDAVGTNTNLGIILLLAPLVAAATSTPAGQILSPKDVATQLQALTPSDCQAVFRAIQIAQPGGLGHSDKLDVTTSQSHDDLIQAMRIGQDRDVIARQYTNNFADIFDRGQRLLATGRQLFSDLNSAIVWTHVAWMAESADTLISRKCGPEIAGQAQAMAQQAMDTLSGDILAAKQPLAEPTAERFWDRVGDLDFWLRSDGHRRNPGTTADMIAATLFVALYNGWLRPPFR